MSWFGVILGIAILCFIWGLIEAKLYKLKRHELRVLPKGSRTMEILQISDLHLRGANLRLKQFLKSQGDKEWDVVLATGDLVGEPAAMVECADILNTYKARLGKFFVLGASDYYAPKFKSYTDYFLKRRRHGTRLNPIGDFIGSLERSGWINLTNRNLSATWYGIEVQITGLDDPYLNRHDLRKVKRDDDAEFSICVVHDPAPFQEAADAGYDLIIAGHTHGGQVRIPFVGAVVTNSTLPTKRARWASGVDGRLLFVSPGLGTGKFAPFRFLCPPEASLLVLEPRE